MIWYNVLSFEFFNHKYIKNKYVKTDAESFNYNFILDKIISNFFSWISFCVLKLMLVFESVRL